MSKERLVGPIVVVLAWPIFTLPSGLDIYFVLLSGHSDWGLLTTMAAGAADWPLWVLGVALVAAVIISVALAAGARLGVPSALLLCWSGVLVWALRLIAEVAVDPGVEVVPALMLGAHAWALRSLHRHPSPRPTTGPHSASSR